MTSSQHRCVFVGNIPYDATEEQLIQICQEVGPVVSFRLVIDRETGKPKGYGFCEYKDEETALSARRNLQGYDINGRQLRVDFAENDRSSDRSREQGRGGPGSTINVDAQKPVGSVSAPYTDPVLQQPVGIQLAASAASSMAGAFMQGNKLSDPGFFSHISSGQDQLTVFLSKMTRSHLYEIMSDLKTVAVRNRSLVRQLLLKCPQLSKALFQAQILLGMVTPQMLQMSSIRQTFATTPQQVSYDNKQAGQPSQIGQMLPPLGLLDNALVSQPFAGQKLPGHPTFPQSSQHPKCQVPTETLEGSLMRSNEVITQFTSRPDGASSLVSAESQQKQMPFLPSLAAEASNIRNDFSLSPAQHPLPQLVLQTGSVAPTVSLGREHGIPGDGMSSTQLSHEGFRSAKNDGVNLTFTHDKLTGLGEENDASHFINTGAAISTVGQKTASVLAPQAIGSNGVQLAEEQAVQILPEVEAALLQQVMNLSAEQLSSLTPEQRQQVIQLQQLLRI